MFKQLWQRFTHAARRLRTWVLVRLGLWRGVWTRGQVTVPATRFLPNLLGADSWNYGLYCPPGLRAEQAAPLVVLLHGCRQRALGFAVASGWSDAADRGRFRLLCPEQRLVANLYRCWNWFHPLAQRGLGEQAVVLHAIDAVAARVAVAPGQVSVVGLSAGAGLAALLAFHQGSRFAAAVTVAAPPLLGTMNMLDPRRVMKRGLGIDPLRVVGLPAQCAPLLIVQGAADEVVHPDCARQLLAQAQDAQRRGGIEPPQVQLALIEGLGHTWTGGPGGHPYTEAGGPALTARAVQFLREHGALARMPGRSRPAPVPAALDA